MSLRQQRQCDPEGLFNRPVPAGQAEVFEMSGALEAAIVAYQPLSTQMLPSIP